MMKNTFYVKISFALDIFNLLSWRFGYAENWLDKKAKVNFKIYEATVWTTNKYNAYIAQYL